MGRGPILPARGASVMWRLAAVLALVAALCAGMLATAGPAAASTTLTFTYTGAAQSWVVPAGVTSAAFAVYGAQSGALQNLEDGGKGGSARAVLAVSPGTTVWIYVGGRGGGFAGCTGAPGAGGFNGGGAGGGGGCPGAGGGGASDVRIGGDTLAQRALIAGGGGGFANGGCGTGAGGGLVGTDGPNVSCAAAAAGGNQDGTRGSGLLLQGGAGAAGGAGLSDPSGGGGGGGGYYGGAGGDGSGGGGGGSGYGPAGVVFETGVRQGDGLVTVTFEAPDPTTLGQVRGTTAYGDATATLTARLTRTLDAAPLAGATVAFAVNGSPVGSAVTNAQGVATLTGVAMPAGLNAGTYANRVCASYAGATGHLPTGPTCGPLVVARRVLTVKPTDRTVGLKQPNPPTTPPAGCVQQQTATSACWLELTNSNTFVNGDDWSDLNLTQFRFQYSRNPASTNASEQVGSVYRITALGATSTNYELRFQPGTLTVK